MSAASSPKQGGLRVLFPTFVNEAWYPEFASEKDKLTARIYKLREEDKQGREYSLQQYPHGYTSYYSENTLYTDPVFENLARFIYQCAHNYGQQQFWDLNNYEPVMTQFWCNINSKNSAHAPHIHPYSQISGVIYLRSDADSPNISFKDPRTSRWMVPPPVVEHRPENVLMTSLSPDAGKLLMFPSWLEHGVAQNQGEGDRISMSYNFEMRLKQT